MPLINSFKIGCDPEFGIVDLKSGFGVTNPAALFKTTAEIGIDGWAVELRPKPFLAAKDLVSHIEALFNSKGFAGSKVVGYKWKAGGIGKFVSGVRDYYYDHNGNRRMYRRQPAETATFGGHIHFQKGCWTTATKRNKYGSMEVYPACEELGKLTQLLEKLDILPAAESATRRRHGYGGRYDMRDDKVETHEFRAMCSWLFHPRVAFVCLAAAKLVVAQTAAFKAICPRLKKNMEFSHLASFVEKFKSVDDDAALLHEKILSLPLSKIQADPTADFKKFWLKEAP